MIAVLQKIIKVVRFYILLKKNKKIVPLCYFDGVPNVGDALNLKLVSAISGWTPIKPPNLRVFKHLCAVGSVLSSMNSNSVVWGSGLISEKAVEDISELGDIRAVRGYLTKKLLEKKFKISLSIPLGDPALLMPLYIKPKGNKVNYRFGLVLHYVDKNNPIKNIVEKQGGYIIDVSLPIDEFINEISKCKIILSSSMHGLILSDAYNIPNQRIVLGDNIIGGDFKFQDYYSTTIEPNSKPLMLRNTITVSDIEKAISLAKVKKNILDLELLLNAFPHDLRK